RWRSQTRPTARLTAVGYRAVAPDSGATAVPIAAAAAFAHSLKRHIAITVPIGFERPSAGFPLRPRRVRVPAGTKTTQGRGRREHAAAPAPGRQDRRYSRAAAQPAHYQPRRRVGKKGDRTQYRLSREGRYHDSA